MKIFYSPKLESVYDSWSFFEMVMTEEIGLPKDTLVLRDKSGKPFLADYTDMYFSVTHTQNHWLCVFSDTPVGIDAELRSRKIKNGGKILERFFSIREQALINESTTPKSDLISIWTKKEACLKVNGLGVLKDMKNIDTENPDFDMHIKQMLMSIDDGTDTLIISVCSQDEAGEINFKVLTD